MQASTDFVKVLKANHFEIKHDHGVGSSVETNDHFKTLHQNYFRSPINQSVDSKALTAARDRKQELIKNHFDFGSPTLLKQGQSI
jgi:hypothetical protein